MYKKFALILIIISFVWIWKDYKKIDTGFVNQSSITYSYDNLNSNFIKKVHVLINSTYENFLYNNIDKHKDYWKIEDKSKRDNLPNFKIPLVAAENIGIGGFKEKVFSATKFILRSINQSQEAAF